MHRSMSRYIKMLWLIQFWAKHSRAPHWNLPYDSDQESDFLCLHWKIRKDRIKDLISTWDQHDLVRPRCRTQQILRRSQRGKHFLQTSRRSISMPTVLSKPENQMFIDFPSIHTAHGSLSIAARCESFFLKVLRCTQFQARETGVVPWLKI